MNKLVDKLKKRVTINRKMFLFLFTLFMVGMIFGSLFVAILKESDQTLIKDSLKQFFTGVTNHTIVPEKAFISSIISQITYVLIVWLLGISVIGFPIVLIFYFSKAFTLGFSIGSILLHYKTKGVLLTLGYIFPHQILNFFIYTILAIYSLSLSLKIFNALVHKKKIDFRFILNKYLLILLLSILGILVSSVFEVFVMPKIVEFIMTFLSI